MRKKEKQKEESRGISNAKPKRGSNFKQRSSNSHRKRGNSTFFACYLLHSLLPGSTASYIGFTVNPCRGLRQHNGEIQNGASQTKKKRPWEMIMCVYGFPSKVSALQRKDKILIFLGCSLNGPGSPSRSVALKKAAACIEPSLRGITRKIKLLYTMLTHPNWESLNLTVNFLSTKHIKHTEDCFPLPPQMQVRTCSLDELPCYTDTQLSDSKDDIARGEHSSDNKDDISRGEHSSDNKDDIARGQHSSSKSATMDPE